MGISPVVSGWHFPWRHPSPPAHTRFLLFLLHWYLEGKGLIKTFCLGLSAPSFFILCTLSSFNSGLITIYCKKKLFSLPQTISLLFPIAYDTAKLTLKDSTWTTPQRVSGFHNVLLTTLWLVLLMSSEERSISFVGQCWILYSFAPTGFSYIAQYKLRAQQIFVELVICSMYGPISYGLLILLLFIFFFFAVFETLQYHDREHGSWSQITWI